MMRQISWRTSIGLVFRCDLRPLRNEGVRVASENEGRKTNLLYSPPSMPRSQGYIPTLDGWRALSIAAVMLFHLPTLTFGGWPLRAVQSRGALGVQVFFVISGLLICTRLLREEERFGKISLSGFYKRRLLRIQPAAILYLLTLLVLAAIHWIPLGMSAWWSALFAWRSYYPKHLWEIPGVTYTNHFWSLAVEEHFYLIIPAVLVFIPRRRRWWALVGIYLLSFVWARMATHWHLTDNRTDVSFELLMLPSLLAIAFYQKKELRAAINGPRVFALVLLICAMLMVSFRWLHGTATGLMFQTLFVCCVFGTSMAPSSQASRILELAPFRFIGRISYSLYLWQQLFCINPVGDRTSAVMARLQAPPVNIFAAFCCALLSYYLVERPFIRLAHVPSAAPRKIDHGVAGAKVGKAGASEVEDAPL